MRRLKIAKLLLIAAIAGCAVSKAPAPSVPTAAPQPASTPAAAANESSAGEAPAAASERATPQPSAESAASSNGAAGSTLKPAANSAASPNSPPAATAATGSNRAATANLAANSNAAAAATAVKRPNSAATATHGGAAPPPAAVPPAAAPPPAARIAKSPPPAPTLNLTELEQRLRDTRAIGVFTKLSLKNQVDDLLNAFRAQYRGPNKRPTSELRQRYDLLLLKVLTLIQDSDPSLASTIASSREALWSILADPEKFAKI